MECCGFHKITPEERAKLESEAQSEPKVAARVENIPIRMTGVATFFPDPESRTDSIEKDVGRPTRTFSNGKTRWIKCGGI